MYDECNPHSKCFLDVHPGNATKIGCNLKITIIRNMLFITFNNSCPFEPT